MTKITNFPPPLHNNKCVTDFKKKSEILNFQFSNQYSLVPDNSALLLTFTPLPTCSLKS